jgi:hypothetical protein
LKADKDEERKHVYGSAADGGNLLEGREELFAQKQEKNKRMKYRAIIIKNTRHRTDTVGENVEGETKGTDNRSDMKMGHNTRYGSCIDS